MYQQLRSRIADAIANRPHAFTVCLGLLITSILLLYNGIVDVPESPRASSEPAVIFCLFSGIVMLPLVGWLWWGRVNEPGVLETCMVFGLALALLVTVWTEYRWPDLASGTLGYAMLILLGSGALLRNEFVLGAFLLVGMAAWFLAEGGAPRASDLPPDNRTLIMASAAVGVAFHVSLRFERHVQADLTSQLVDQINNDPLTGVLSRTGMFQHLEGRELDPDAPVWCLYADVDYFKSINDDFGHDRGDEVLKAVAGAISRSTDPGSLVARWGGDEFIAIGQGEPPSELELEALIRRDLERCPPGPCVTVGVAVSAPDRDASEGEGRVRFVEDMVTASDRRMYARRNELRGDDPVRSVTRNH